MKRVMKQEVKVSFYLKNIKMIAISVLTEC